MAPASVLAFSILSKIMDCPCIGNLNSVTVKYNTKNICKPPPKKRQLWQQLRVQGLPGFQPGSVTYSLYETG